MGTGSDEAEDGAHEKLVVLQVRTNTVLDSDIVLGPPVALLGKPPDPGSNPAAVICLALFFVPEVATERHQYCPRHRSVPDQRRHVDQAPALRCRDHQMVLRQTSRGVLRKDDDKGEKKQQ